MKLHFGGVRGTSAVTRATFTRYGGDTTSLLFEGAGGGRIVIDAGTGILNISQRIRRAPGTRHVLLLLSHYHLDHLMGLPSFAPLYDAEWRITFAAPAICAVSAREAVTRILGQPFWPLQLEAMAAHVAFMDLPGTVTRPLVWGGLTVRWCSLHHPGGGVAYRIDETATGAAAVFATDVEWAESSPQERSELLRLCSEPSRAGLLICDGQFLREEYPAFLGWGHSTLEDAAELGRATGVDRLLVTHHAPDHDDRKLDVMQEHLASLLPGALLARQGEDLTLMD